VYIGQKSVEYIYTNVQDRSNDYKVKLHLTKRYGEVKGFVDLEYLTYQGDYKTIGGSKKLFITNSRYYIWEVSQHRLKDFDHRQNMIRVKVSFKYKCSVKAVLYCFNN
jgi:hypothetical protein